MPWLQSSTGSASDSPVKPGTRRCGDDESDLTYSRHGSRSNDLPPPRSAQRTRAAPRSTRKPAAAPSPRAGAPPANLDKVTALVIADAVRMLNWGREWPQIAGLIARLADRPGEPDVWKILRSHRAEIEAQARRPLD